MGRVDGREPRLKRRIDQERVHSRPIAFVILLLWQADAEIVCLISQIQFVEPVAGIIAVLVERLRRPRVRGRNLQTAENSDPRVSLLDLARLGKAFPSIGSRS